MANIDFFISVVNIKQILNYRPMLFVLREGIDGLDIDGDDIDGVRVGVEYD